MWAETSLAGWHGRLSTIFRFRKSFDEWADCDEFLAGRVRDDGSPAALPLLEFI